MQQHISTTQQGSVIVFALIILSLIMVSTLGMARVTLTEQNNAIVTKNSSVALQNADAGIEEFLQQVYSVSNALDTLDDVVANMGNDFVCVDGSITRTTGDFEILAHKKVIVGGIESTDPIDDCDTTQLADVSFFKVIGEYHDAARALQLTLQDSLSRGLVAHWSFEDNADAIAYNGNDPGSPRSFEDNADAIAYNGNDPGSPIAKDYSKNNHILTLCPMDLDEHGLDDDGLDGVDGDESFDYCHQYVGGDDGVLGDVNEDNDLIDATWMDHGSAANDSTPAAKYRESAWGVQGDENGYEKFSGIVDESASIPPVAWIVPYGQALYFNGKSNYLTMNTSRSGRTNYVSDDSALKPTSELAISLWVKRRSDGVNQILLSSPGYATNRGYQISLNTDNKIVVNMRNRSITSGLSLAGDTWYHVVVTWSSSNDNKVKLYIDNTLEGSSPTLPQNIIYNTSTPFMIGARYTRNDGGEPTFPDDIADPFGGYLDDIRIYDRGLTVTEIERLCQKGAAGASDWNGCS